MRYIEKKIEKVLLLNMPVEETVSTLINLRPTCTSGEDHLILTATIDRVRASGIGSDLHDKIMQSTAKARRQELRVEKVKELAKLALGCCILGGVIYRLVK